MSSYGVSIGSCEDTLTDSSWGDYRAGLWNGTLPSPSEKVYQAGDREDMPRRPMRRGEWPGYSFAERAYIFFRNYVCDVEMGRIKCTDASYLAALRMYERYKALSDGEIQVEVNTCYGRQTVYLPITNTTYKALIADDREGLKRLAIEQHGPKKCEGWSQIF